MAPRWEARAPGRVNLIGEHTDYNEGYVLPMAIERHTSILAAPNGADHILIRSAALDECTTVALHDDQVITPGPHWSNYLRGVINGFVDAGHDLRGFNALIRSDVPLGGGLASSAALEVATASLLEAISGVQLEPAKKAFLCQTAEHRYAGVPCGIMDQLASTLARKDHLMLLDCRSGSVEHIPFQDVELSIVIVNSNIKHELASGEYAIRRKQCEMAAAGLHVGSLRDVPLNDLYRSSDALDETVFRRARHVVTEIGRTLTFADCLRAKEWVKAGELMYESHSSLQKDFEVSCPELDIIVESAQRIGLAGGIYGCRMTGGGFGGCAVALVRSSAESSVFQSLADDYTNRTGIRASIFSSRPAAGASAGEWSGAGTES